MKAVVEACDVLPTCRPPAGYFLRDGYICTLHVTKNGEEDLTRLCPALVVEARYRLRDGHGWGR